MSHVVPPSQGTAAAQDKTPQYRSQSSAHGEMRNAPEERVVYRSRSLGYGGQHSVRKNDLQHRPRSMEYTRERNRDISYFRQLSAPARQQGTPEEHSGYRHRSSGHDRQQGTENEPLKYNRTSSEQGRQQDAFLSAVTRLDPSGLAALLAGKASLGSLFEELNWSELLHTAVRSERRHSLRQEANRRKILRMLLCAGAFPDSAADDGVTLLHVTAKDEKINCLKELLRWKVNINAADIWGRTPLLDAAEAGSISCVKALLEAGAAVDVKDKDGWTALLLASRSGHAEVVRWLLSFGADPNYVRREDGKTPLHVASTNEVVEVLLQAGAETVVKDLKGVTPVERIIRDLPSAAHDVISASMLSWGRLRSSDLHVAFNFDIFKNGTNHETNLLLLMLKKQKVLLKHPVCETFLHLKWLRIRQLFYANLIFFFIYMIFLTSSVCLKAQMSALELDLPGYNNSTDHLNTVEAAAETISELSLVLVIVLILREIVQMVCMRTDYWRQKENLLELLLVILSLIVLIPPGSILEDWQRGAGVLALLLGWYEVTLYVGRFPAVGIYIQLFSAVTKRMLHFLAVYSFMFFGFAVSFHLLQPAVFFASFTNSMLQTLSMMAGELDYSELSGESNDLPGMTELLYVIFVVMMAVVTMNLLVGLAVQDIQALMREAGVDRLASTVVQESYIERFFLSRLFTMFPKTSSRILEKYFVLSQVPSRRFVDGTFRDPPIANDQRKALLRAKYNVFLCPNASRHPRRLNLGVTLAGEPVPSPYSVPSWILANILRLLKEKETVSTASRPSSHAYNVEMKVRGGFNQMEGYSYSEGEEEEEEEEEREKWTRNDASNGNVGAFEEGHHNSEVLRNLSDRLKTLESSLNLLLLATTDRMDDGHASRALLERRGSRGVLQTRQQQQTILEHLDEEETSHIPLEHDSQEHLLLQHQAQEPQSHAHEFQESQVQQTTL